MRLTVAEHLYNQAYKLATPTDHVPNWPDWFKSASYGPEMQLSRFAVP